MGWSRVHDSPRWLAARWHGGRVDINGKLPSQLQMKRWFCSLSVWNDSSNVITFLRWLECNDRSRGHRQVQKSRPHPSSPPSSLCPPGHLHSLRDDFTLQSISRLNWLAFLDSKNGSIIDIIYKQQVIRNQLRNYRGREGGWGWQRYVLPDSILIYNSLQLRKQFEFNCILARKRERDIKLFTLTIFYFVRISKHNFFFH